MRFSEDRIEKLTCSDNILRDIHIWEAEQPRAIFLAIHGAMDHAGNFMLPGLYFRDKGITTVAHEQQGHDKKKKVYISRFEVFLDDLDLMWAWVTETYPDIPVFIMGHSMGGLVATHYALTRMNGNPRFRGFIISSPYYVNAVKTPKIVERLAGIIAFLAPRMAIPLEDITGNLTHDEHVYLRHRTDEKDGIMATLASARFANELLKAQKWVPDHMASWKHPLLAIVAGNEKVADASASRKLLGLINPGLLTELYYPENYHENFNELNRDEIFGKIMEWVETRI